MKVYDLYGFPFHDLERMTEELESLLSISFTAHESSFIGDYYLHGRRYGKDSLLLRWNYGPEDDTLSDPEFPNFPVLLEANVPAAPDALRRTLEHGISGCRLLRRKQA